MRLFVLAFACGVWLLQQQARLPGAEQSLVLGPVASLALVLGSIGRGLATALRLILCRSLLLVGAVAPGFLWAAGFGHWRQAEALPPRLKGQDMEVIGVVSGLPQKLERGARFAFDVEQALPAVPPQVSLAWYRGGDESLRVPVRAGERRHFTVSFKRPQRNINPQGFDYEAWLFERGIRATGYVRPKLSAERIDLAPGG